MYEERTAVLAPSMSRQNSGCAAARTVLSLPSVHLGAPPAAGASTHVYAGSSAENVYPMASLPEHIGVSTRTCVERHE